MIELLTAVALLGSSGAATDAPMAGRIVDAEGAPVAGALVVVCDAESGIPLFAEDWKPFTRAMDRRNDDASMNLVRDVTDAEGRFAFDEATAGRYRLIAQTWDRNGPADQGSDSPSSPRQLFGKNGKVLTVRGVADSVVVPSPEASALTLHPLGTASLTIDLPIGNDGLLVTVSRAAPPADPILGFAAWSGPFLQQAIAGNRALDGDTTIHGLPAGPLWVQVFANDNNPGFGVAPIQLQANQVTKVDVPIVASWSDGHHEPPTRLRPLVDQLAGMTDPGPVMMNACSEVGLDPSMIRGPQMWGAMIPYLGKEVAMPDGNRVRFADLAASFGYLRLQKMVEARGR